MSRLRTKIRDKLIRLLIQTPRSESALKLLRLYCDTLDGERTGDMDYNGEFNVMLEQLPYCSTVIDAGACSGQWASKAIEANPNIDLYCLEPLRGNFDQLCSHPHLSRAKCFQFALGSGNQMLDMDPETQSMHRVNSKQPEQVEQITLDNFLKDALIENVDFLKLDVEGHEIDVLKGATHALSQGRIKRVQFEYGPDWIFARTQLRDAFQVFHAHGFVIHHILPRSTKRIDQYSSWLENYRYKNFLALHSSVLS